MSDEKPSFNDDERIHLEAALIMYAKASAQTGVYASFVRAVDLFLLISKDGSVSPQLSQIPKVWLDYYQARTRGENVEPPKVHSVTVTKK